MATTGKEVLVTRYWPLLFTLWFSTAWAQDDPVRADRVVVVVDDVVLTTSHLALHHAMVERDPSSVPAIGNSAMDPLNASIDSAIIRNLAGQVPVYQPSPADIRARVSRFRDGWASPREYMQFLWRHGLNDDRLAGLLKQRMVVERVIRRNIPPRPGETNEAYLSRYNEWITEQRKGVRIRQIPEPSEP